MWYNISKGVDGVKIAIGCDHGGFTLKEIVKIHLIESGYEVEDFGCYNEESVSYVEYGILVAQKVSSGEFERGIVICGSGIGISIAANKVDKIRCALVHDLYSAKLTRLHNDANMLAMGGRIIASAHALAIVDEWLTTEFEGDRHMSRIQTLLDYEVKNHG